MASAAKLKSVLGAPTEPTSVDVPRSAVDGAAVASGAMAGVSDAVAAGDTCTWSAATFWNVTSKLFGWGGGTPGICAGSAGRAAPPVPGTKTTSTLPSTTAGER